MRLTMAVLRTFCVTSHDVSYRIRVVVMNDGTAYPFRALHVAEDKERLCRRS